MALALLGADGNRGNEDADLGDGLLLLRHHPVELAGDLGLLGIVRLQSVAGILDDGAASPWRRPPGQDRTRRRPGSILRGADKVIGGFLAGIGVEGDVPFVEELA